MAQKNKSIKQRLIAGFLTIAGIILIAGILGGVAITWLRVESTNVGVKNAPLGDAAMEIKLTSALAHLELEELLAMNNNEGKKEKYKEVENYLNESIWYVDAILKGGENEEGTYYKSKDKKVIELMTEVKTDLVNFKEQAKKRYDNSIKGSGIGSVIDQQFDELYEKTQESIDNLIEEYKGGRNGNILYLAGDSKYLLANGHLFFEELLSGDEAVKFSDIETDFNTANNNIKRISDIIGERETRDISKNLEAFIKTTKDRYEKKTAQSIQNETDEKNFNAAFEEYFDQAEEAETAIQDEMAKGIFRMKLAANIGIIILILAILLSLVLAVIIGLNLASGISNPLLNVSTVLKDASNQIASASNQLSSSAQDIANSSQEIASGATEQASSIEETTSSIEELASMVKQNAQNSKEASVLSDKGSESAQEGHEQMENMLVSMQEISKGSDEIRKIIKVIDDIAFQTNILALNAAVEAARAGESGMGFAVVADEVKNLASRSADAAKETSVMIEESIKKTEVGVSLANKLSEVFKEILSNSQKVAEMSKEVESASLQQDSGIDQVNKAIIQFDKVVQANAGAAEEMASSSEETAGSAEELLSQSENLKEIVEKLITIVNGSSNSSYVNVEPKRIEQKATVKPKKTKKKTTQKKIDIKKDHTEISPEEVIPFEEDEEFKDV